MDDKKISFGMNCKDSLEELKYIEISNLVEKVKSVDVELVGQTTFLRTVLRYSKERYRAMKTKLPFISMSSFDPKYRKYENFVSSCGWILDIDSEEAIDSAIIEKIMKDQRISVAFRSPNGTGLKLIFLFQEVYEDKIRYTEAYKAFSNEFGLRYNVINKIDFKNCDVSRICFICHDAECYYNSEALTIDPTSYHNEISLINFEAERKPEVIPAETYRNILEKLGSKPRPPKTRPFVPEELLSQKEHIVQLIEESEIKVKEIEEIQYGLKIEVIHGKEIGEVLIYYGRSGYKILSSPQKIYNHGLSDTVRQMLQFKL